VVVKPRSPSTPAGACPEDGPQDPSCVIYSVGYTPAKDPSRRQKVRVVKARYVRGPAFSAGLAIQTNGDLNINGNLKVTGAAGSGHANGRVRVAGASSSVAGYLTASGNECLNCRTVSKGNPSLGLTDAAYANRPRKDLPVINPRENYALSEYDLCPDGTVRAGPSYSGPTPPNGTTQPCSGSQLAATAGTALPFMGWKRTGTSADSGALWTYSGTGLDHGVFYVYQGSASWNGSRTNTWEVTLLTEASPTTGVNHSHCPHVGGDIEITGNPKMRARTANLLLVAGRDITVSGNVTGGDPANYEGAVAAHEQIAIKGTPKFAGPILSNDTCNTDSSLFSGVDFQLLTGNTQVNYEGGLKLPFGISLRVTNWEEL